MMNKSKLALAAFVSLSFAAQAHATVITGELYNTGLDAAGNPVATPGGIDENWDITPPDADAITYSHTAYEANNGGSQWISSNASGGEESTSLENYTFTTTFDLTGYAASTATITGTWGVDNWATIYLNGNDTGVFLPFGPSSFSSLNAFALNNDFIGGINTLSVMLTNGYPNDPDKDPGPFALRFDTLVLSADEVPEPGTLGLFGLGLLGAGMARKRRKS